MISKNFETVICDQLNLFRIKQHIVSTAIRLHQKFVQNKAKNLMESYLNNRKQFVQIGEIVSQVKPISMGVPQGSVIGPLLFNTVINDIIKSSSKFSFILYADDTTLNSTLDNFSTNPVDIE